MSKVLENLNQLQDRTVNRIIKKLKEQNKAFIQMPTGTGKTEVMVKAVKKLKPKKQVLIVVHMTDLVDNIFERFNKYNFLSVGIFDGRHKELDMDIVVAGVQTLGQQHILKYIDPSKFELIIIDEAHHAGATAYDKILSHFDAPVIGMTATPYRPDGIDLSEYFGPVMKILSFTEAQKRKFLAKDKSYAILTNSALEGYVTTKGDYSASSLGRLFDTNDRMNVIVKSYKKYGRDEVFKAGMLPKGICFCVSAQHAIKMAEMFNLGGVPSSYLLSDRKKMSADERSEEFKSFMNTNDIEVMCVVGILGEGVDIPDANICIMARPTRSPILYTQSIGRTARSSNGKKQFFVVLDYVDNSSREFHPYNMGNLKQNANAYTNVVVDYLTETDNLIIDERVNDLFHNVDNFEMSCKKRIKMITEENLLYMIKTGKVDERIYG